jgi:cell fate (sporulation/competence/biofilm development) regulator YmcA (YheA/YmcA/DUF963 family)
MSESATNDDLKELHGLLVTQVTALVDRLDEAETVDEVKKIQDEITELNHRVTLVGNLLFTQKTAGITKAMDKVREGTADVKAATAKIQSLSDFLGSMSKFLGLVDKVIDTAKKLTPLGGV